MTIDTLWQEARMGEARNSTIDHLDKLRPCAIEY
jgi:hypothetical protein